MNLLPRDITGVAAAHWAAVLGLSSLQRLKFVWSVSAVLFGKLGPFGATAVA